MMRFINGQLEPVECRVKMDTSKYHAENGGRASEAIKSFIATHDDSNSYSFNAADIADIYGLSLENMNYGIDIADIIKTAVYAGMCAAEWADKPQER